LCLASRSLLTLLTLRGLALRLIALALILLALALRCALVPVALRLRLAGGLVAAVLLPCSIPVSTCSF